MDGAPIGICQKKKILSDKSAEGNPGKRQLTVPDFAMNAANPEGQAESEQRPGATRKQCTIPKPAPRGRRVRYSRIIQSSCSLIHLLRVFIESLYGYENHDTIITLPPLY